LNDLAGMNGKSNDRRLPSGLSRRYLHLLDEEAVSQMYPVEEANRGHRWTLRMYVFYYIHLFKNLAQIIANVIMMCMDAYFFSCLAISFRVIDEEGFFWQQIGIL